MIELKIDRIIFIWIWLFILSLFNKDVVEAKNYNQIFIEYADYYTFDEIDKNTYSVDEVSSKLALTSVNTKMEKYSVRAIDTGNAYIKFENKITKRFITYNFVIKPADLTVIYLTGQSNAEGQCPDNNYYPQDSVACNDGSVFSMFLVRNSNSRKIIQNDSARFLSNAPISDFIPSDLLSNKSLSGSSLEYPIDSLTQSGKGKCGPDAGIAYEWNRLTGDKVWIINTAVGGSDIDKWIPEHEYYNDTIKVAYYAKKMLEKEVKAGHIKLNKQLMVYLQGEADSHTDINKYMSDLQMLYDGFVSELNLDRIGFIMPRAATASQKYSDDLIMTAPRLAQYIQTQNGMMKTAVVASDVNRLWIEDNDVYSYFHTKYKYGLDYPKRDNSSLESLPNNVEDVHPMIHYTQIGHNENGITAADGLYESLYGKDNGGESITWVTDSEYNINQIVLKDGEHKMVFPISNKSFFNRNISVTTDSENITYDSKTCVLAASKKGVYKLYASDINGKIVSILKIIVEPHIPVASVEYRDGRWIYCEDGIQNSDFTGIASNENGDWYIVDGFVDFLCSGLVDVKIHGKNQWIYIVNGKVDYNTVSIVKNENGWWYVHDGYVDFNAMTVAKNEYGWWYIQDGKVNFQFNGIAGNDYGDWVIKNGEVDFERTAVIKVVQSDFEGWYYVKKGKVQYGHETVQKNEYGWWYIGMDGKVDFNKNTVAPNEYGWWCIQDGKVNFDYNGIAENKNGKWYIKNGKVEFSFSGNVLYKYKWFYVQNGKVK